MLKRIVLMLLLLPVVALADLCPKDGELITTTPYVKTHKCGTLTIIVEGETNPEQYQSFLGEVPAAKEEAFYPSSGQPRRPLPTVASLFPTEDTFIQKKVWMVSEIECLGAYKIMVRYWGGGNCSKCEQSVRYVFNKDSVLRETHLEKVDVGPTAGQMLKPEWLVSASYKFTLGVYDKWTVNNTFRVKYIVKFSNGTTFVAWKVGLAMNAESSEVIFPDNFHVQGTELKAFSGLGQDCTWEIYVDDELVVRWIVTSKRTQKNTPWKYTLDS